MCNSLRVRFRSPTSLKTREARVLSVDGKGYQVCVILNVVKNLRTKWVLGIGVSGKILRLRCAPLRMTRFFGSLSVSAGAKLPQSDCLKSAIRQLAAASPVAALTVPRTVIHYRDCASLTLTSVGAEIPPYGGSFRCFANNYPFSIFHLKRFRPVPKRHRAELFYETLFRVVIFI